MKDVVVGKTKNRLLDLIKRRGEVSLETAVAELHLAKSTVRQHLLAMENQNLLERKYGRVGQGRPKVLFRLAEAGKQLYPTKEPALLRNLIDFLNTSGRQDLLRSFFEAHWADFRDRFTVKLTAISKRKGELNARLQALRDLLQEEGFMPEIVVERDRIMVRECHCPFSETIRVTTLPCRLELDFINWALNMPVYRTQHIPGGGGACSYVCKMSPHP